MIEVKLNDLYVGDVVKPKPQEIIYFKGLIAAETSNKDYIPYVIANEKLFNRHDRPV